MDSILKKGLFLVTLTGSIAAFPAVAEASDPTEDYMMPRVGIEEVLSDCYLSEKREFRLRITWCRQKRVSI